MPSKRRWRASRPAIQEGEANEREVEKKYQDLLATIPNTPAADVPVGPDAEANVELRKVGTPKKFPFQPKQHFELGEALGLMDFETAARNSQAPIRRLERIACAARTCARPVHARSAHERAWLHRDQSATARPRRRHVRHGATAEVQGRSVPTSRSVDPFEHTRQVIELLKEKFLEKVQKGVLQLGSDDLEAVAEESKHIAATEMTFGSSQPPKFH